MRLLSRHAPEVGLQRLGSNEAIEHAILGQLGIAVLSLHTLRHEPPNSQLAILDMERFPLQRQHQWKVVYPKGKKPSVIAQAFFELLDAQGRSLAQDLDEIRARLSRHRETKKAVRAGEPTDDA